MTVEQLQTALDKLKTEAASGLRPELFQFLKLWGELEVNRNRWFEIIELLREMNQFKDVSLYKQIQLMLRQELYDTKGE